jgi:hypothetical protein
VFTPLDAAGNPSRSSVQFVFRVTGTERSNGLSSYPILDGERVLGAAVLGRLGNFDDSALVRQLEQQTKQHGLRWANVIGLNPQSLTTVLAPPGDNRVNEVWAHSTNRDDRRLALFTASLLLAVILGLVYTGGQHLALRQLYRQRGTPGAAREYGWRTLWFLPARLLSSDPREYEVALESGEVYEADRDVKPVVRDIARRFSAANPDTRVLLRERDAPEQPSTVFVDGHLV